MFGCPGRLCVFVSQWLRLLWCLGKQAAERVQPPLLSGLVDAVATGQAAFCNMCNGPKDSLNHAWLRIVFQPLLMDAVTMADHRRCSSQLSQFVLSAKNPAGMVAVRTAEHAAGIVAVCSAEPGWHVHGCLHC